MGEKPQDVLRKLREELASVNRPSLEPVLQKVVYDQRRLPDIPPPEQRPHVVLSTDEKGRPTLVETPNGLLAIDYKPEYPVLLPIPMHPPIVEIDIRRFEDVARRFMELIPPRQRLRRRRVPVPS